MLSQTAIYAVRAMGYIAKHKEDQPIPSHAISEAMSIPHNYLCKVMNRLVQYTRSPVIVTGPVIRTLSWMRLGPDLIFVACAVLILIFIIRGTIKTIKNRQLPAGRFGLRAGGQTLQERRRICS